MFQCERVRVFVCVVWCVMWMCVATVCVFHSLTQSTINFELPTKINIYINGWKIKSGIDIKKKKNQNKKK